MQEINEIELARTAVNIAQCHLSTGTWLLLLIAISWKYQLIGFSYFPRNRMHSFIDPKLSHSDFRRDNNKTVVIVQSIIYGT